MGKNGDFTVEITSDFERFWCYNILVTCGCFDADDHQVGFASADDTVCPIGSNLERQPEGYPSRRVVRLDAQDCDHLLMYVYVIPHTVPLGRDVDDQNFFTLDVKISRAGQVVQRMRLSVNRWAGGSFEVRS